MPSFMEHFDRLSARDYLPSDQDILRSRSKTTGIIETVFELNSRTFRILDIGGQPSQRKKWINFFDGVPFVMFLVAMSGFDEALVEDYTAVSSSDVVRMVKADAR